ncbi:MAG: hypothetical protein NT080_09345 [Spirochaetes bacterium]|nr:hypothetical protein [Spirochaetota bacterium]
MRRIRSSVRFLALIVAFAAASAVTVFAQQSSGAAPTELPVTRVVLFSSGVGYFEHRGNVTGDAVVLLPFGVADVNDALKSLVVRDEGSGSPSVSYPSQESLDRALKGFRVDLSGAPRVADMLARLRGAEISVDVPATLTGRIVGVEQRPGKEPGTTVQYLVILTQDGVRALPMDGIAAFRFTDRRITDDFERALALVLAAQDTQRRVLELKLPGTQKREAAVGYVVAAPIWKASYRLDLAGAKPYFQGWAIVDNPTEEDWRNVQLSLVSGRPVSFIQDLYSPLYVERPEIPLAIAGAAKPRSFESGLAGAGDEESYAEEYEKDKAYGAAPRSAMAPSPSPSAKAASGGVRGSDAPSEAMMVPREFETARAKAAGELFEFTVKKPVTLERRRSAMLPLVAAELQVEKVSVYAPDKGAPMVGARITNNTGMKLPAGPITVFDGGVYAGDALVDFLPEKDKRLIVYGDDLSLIADSLMTSAEETIGVAISKGVLKFSRRTTWTRTYNFRNSGAIAKRVVIEHPVIGGAELFEPKAYEEKAGNVYRFSLPVASGAQVSYVVKERSPRTDAVLIGNLGNDALVMYSSSKEIPPAVRDALKKATDLRRRLDDAKRALADLQARKNDLSTEQGRIRQNLDAVGSDTSQGQQYLKKLLDAENEIEAVSKGILEARKAAQDAQTAYETYLANLSIE